MHSQFLHNPPLQESLLQKPLIQQRFLKYATTTLSSTVLSLYCTFCFATNPITVNSTNTSSLPSISTSQKDLQITSHGFALYGDLKYSKNATHLDYVNPNAPKGGTLTLMGHGTFDTLNPYLLKGSSPWNTPGLSVFGFSQLHDTLLAGTDQLRRSGDEAQSAYGLIAESLTYSIGNHHNGSDGDNHSDNLHSNTNDWVTFTLRPEARFHDGEPIEADDVVFSFYTLTQNGSPTYAITYQQIEKVTAISKRQVKFEFKQTGNTNKRPLILRAGELPILPKHYFTGSNPASVKRDFTKTGLTPILGSGPYKVAKVISGKKLILERVKDYWAKDLFINKGLYNFDKINTDFYLDPQVAFEAFKSGAYDIHLDYISKNWSTGYRFPALTAGKVIKAEIPHQQPQGTQAFFFNTRNPLFQDRKVRKAISLLFDFEWSNKALFHNAYRRSTSYFPNSPFSAQSNPKFNYQLQTPVTNGSGRIRHLKRQALQLLKEAGWELKDQQLVSIKNQQPFVFELLNRTNPSWPRVILPFKQNLSSIGITLHFRMVDAAQYKERIDHFDFDMTTAVLPQSLAPGDKPQQYFHSKNADTIGSLNLSGIKNPAVNQLIKKVEAAQDFQSISTAMQALDSVLLSEHYAIPHWYIDYHRLAYWSHLQKPKQVPPYSLGTQSWWVDTNTSHRQSR